MDKKTLIVITDYGDQFAAAQVKAVALACGFGGNWIENHSVTPFSVVEGAFQIKVIEQHAPNNRVVVGVIDPGVGSHRRGLIIKTKKGWLVGPDNGLLFPAAETAGVEKVWVINDKFFGLNLPKTFHGRDIFIKCGVWLTQDKNPKDFGCTQTDKFNKLKFKNGQVVHIDAFGNVKVYTKSKPIKLDKTFTDVPIGSPIKYWGSSDTLELGVNQGRGVDYFGVKLGEIIEL